MDFQGLQGPYGSRLKFWIVPQAEAPLWPLSGSWPSSGIRACSEDSLDRRRCGPRILERLIMRSLAKPDTGFSHPKIQNPESGIRDVPCDFGSKILDPESGKGGGGG